MKTYAVNKKRLLLIDSVILLIMLAIPFLMYIVFKKTEFLAFFIMPVFVAITLIPSIKSSFKTSITLTDDKIICKNFNIGTSFCNAEVNYEQITKITFKRRCALIIAGADEKHPIVISRSFKDYKELLSTVCKQCKLVNPNITIDPEIYEMIK